MHEICRTALQLHQTSSYILLVFQKRYILRNLLPAGRLCAAQISIAGDQRIAWQHLSCRPRIGGGLRASRPEINFF